MAYAVRIDRIAQEAGTALYRWESTQGRAGHVAVEVATRTFRPADETGAASGAMTFRAGDAEVTAPDPDAETVRDFVTAATGILRKWKGAEPPETAHLYFG